MVVERSYVLAAYRKACQRLPHDQAVAEVSNLTGQSVETVQAVIDEEAATC
jgi:hypothetical protein